VSKYQLSFWFEHGGFCIWSKNNNAKEKYGYAIKNDALPISEELACEINVLKEEYATYLDWDEPQNPSPWTVEHKADFYSRATAVYEELKNELGSDFQIANEISRCIE